MDMSFEQWCVEVEKIPYYNMLTEKEYEYLRKEYERWKIIKPQDLKIDAFFRKRRKGMDTSVLDCAFVKIEHIPSGITVTKQSSRGQMKAKGQCMEELEILVELWEGVN